VNIKTLVKGFIIVCLNIALMTFSVTASAYSLGPLVQVSGTSPYGSLEACGSNPGMPSGINFVNSEAEPWVAVNPSDPDNIVAMWLQDIWTNGLTRGHVAGVSLDGGSTWDRVSIPGLGDCSGGRFDRVADPWLSFGPTGVLHQISLALNIDPPPGRTGGLGNNALLVSKSEDGGITWSDPISLIEDPNGILNDKPSITADPTDANFVYASWDRFEPAKSVVVAPLTARLLWPFGLGLKGRFYFARSTDGGESWEPARKIYNPGGNNSTLGEQIIVLPDGTLVVFFGEFLAYRNDDRDNQFDFNLSLLRSPDKGETWLPRSRPLRFADIISFGNMTPDEGSPVFGGIFDVAVDRGNGTLYAVWQDIRFTQVDAIAFSMSTDGGFTWSAPIKVNQTPSNAAILREQAFLPSVAVNGDGVVAVTYYDFRNDDASGELVDYFGVWCSTNCTNADNWNSNEVRLTDASFDILDAPYASGVTTGFFLGDYAGLAVDNDDFLAVFAMPHDGDPDSIFFRRFRP